MPSSFCTARCVTIRSRWRRRAGAGADLAAAICHAGAADEHHYPGVVFHDGGEGSLLVGQWDLQRRVPNLSECHGSSRPNKGGRLHFSKRGGRGLVGAGGDGTHGARSHARTLATTPARMLVQAGRLAAMAAACCYPSPMPLTYDCPGCQIAPTSDRYVAPAAGGKGRHTKSLPECSN
jgi:hypothetical protein